MSKPVRRRRHLNADSDQPASIEDLDALTVENLEECAKAAPEDAPPAAISRVQDHSLCSPVSCGSGDGHLYVLDHQAAAVFAVGIRLGAMDAMHRVTNHLPRASA